MKSGLQKKCGYTRQTAHSHFGCCCTKKCEDQLRQMTHNLQHALQSAPRLTAGFSNTYC